MRIVLSVQHTKHGQRLIRRTPVDESGQLGNPVATGHQILQDRDPGGWGVYRVSPDFPGQRADGYLSVHAALDALREHLESSI